MTSTSEHLYTARILGGGGDLELSITDAGGRVTLDASAIPHVQGDITLAVEDAALLENLDPRDSRRVVIDVDATFPDATRTRSFNLGIRKATPNRAAGTVTLQLASDEALLTDYAPLVDDGNTWQFQYSLRALTNYVLGKIGATLQPGTADADMTAYWSATNLVPNPSVRGVLGNWIAGGVNGTLARMTGLTGSPVPGVTTYTRTTWTGNSGLGQGGAFGQTGTVAPTVTMNPFEKYRVAVWVRSNVAKPVRLSVQIFAQDGSVLNGGLDIHSRTLVANTWTLLQGTFEAPANAALMGLFSYVQSGSQWVSGNTFDTLGWIVHEGTLSVPFFDAATSDTRYIYETSGAAHVSASTRRPFPLERSPESLLWTAGTTAMDFLRPLLTAAGLRLVCDEHRSWTLRNAEYRAPGNQTYRYAANIEDVTESLSIEDDLGGWFDGAVYVYTWRDRNEVQQRRTDSFAMSSSPKKVITVELSDTPYPGPGRAEQMVRRAQGRGRMVTSTAIPTWLEQTDQTLSIVLEGTPIQTGIAGAVSYDFTNDTVTVSSRTTDTPASAWILVPTGQTWKTAPSGPIKSEVI